MSLVSPSDITVHDLDALVLVMQPLECLNQLVEALKRKDRGAVIDRGFFHESLAVILGTT